MTPLSRNCCSARLPVCPAARLPSCPQCTSFAELPVCPRAKLPLCLGARVAQLHYLVSCPAASIGRLSICPYTTTALPTRRTRGGLSRRRSFSPSSGTDIYTDVPFAFAINNFAPHEKGLRASQVGTD